MFTWKEEFELGIEPIDTQHKNLIEIGNRIESLLVDKYKSTDDYGDVLDLLEELVNYTEYHFKTEEELLSYHLYPDYKEHKKEHDEFIEYLSSIELGRIEEDMDGFLKELLRKVVNWVFKHIITTDFLYKDFLKKSQL